MDGWLMAKLVLIGVTIVLLSWTVLEVVDRNLTGAILNFYSSLGVNIDPVNQENAVDLTIIALCVAILLGLGWGASKLVRVVFR